jgi:hypothetical protein
MSSALAPKNVTRGCGMHGPIPVEHNSTFLHLVISFPNFTAIASCLYYHQTVRFRVISLVRSYHCIYLNSPRQPKSGLYIGITMNYNRQHEQ